MFGPAALMERPAAASQCSTSYGASAPSRSTARRAPTARRGGGGSARRAPAPARVATGASSLEAALEVARDPPAAAPRESSEEAALRAARAERAAARLRERATYQFAAIAATAGVVSLATVATYARVQWHMAAGDAAVPWAELAAQLALALGGAVGMEMYARWAHRFLWHDFEPGWALHKSHHEPRVGAFEANDVYALANAAPAIALCAGGFLTPGVGGGLAFGAGLGITLFGISYMYVHDGLVHRRFPVGPIADVPALRRIAVAHQLHHSEKYGGLPFGMFLGPQELEAAGAGPELDRMCAELERKARAAKGLLSVDLESEPEEEA
jgi:beta-carotene 3-hydroxylase